MDDQQKENERTREEVRRESEKTREEVRKENEKTREEIRLAVRKLLLVAGIIFIYQCICRKLHVPRTGF